MILVFAKNIAKKIQRPAIITIIQKISLSSDPYFTLTIVILITSDAYFPGKVYLRPYPDVGILLLLDHRNGTMTTAKNIRN